MLVGVCELELFIHSSNSLKEKRFVLKSIKDQVMRKFNVSIAEVKHLDKWQLAGLGIATVSNEKRVVQQTFDEIIKLIEFKGETEIVSQSVQIY
ncbi:DUF503 domain-containing protein [bacterium]|nr:MAG: DUF503 domain-containing protein [bacterium]MBL7958621.1 DUF503 domain-containing protein [bacterium]